MLQDLLSDWRAEGFTSDDVQVWAIGWAGQGAMAGTFAHGATSPLMADSSSGPDGVYAAWEAGIDDLFLLDREGWVRFRANLVSMDLGDKKHRRALDSWVHELLAE